MAHRCQPPGLVLVSCAWSVLSTQGLPDTFRFLKISPLLTPLLKEFLQPGGSDLRLRPQNLAYVRCLCKCVRSFPIAAPKPKPNVGAPPVSPLLRGLQRPTSRRRPRWALIWASEEEFAFKTHSGYLEKFLFWRKGDCRSGVSSLWGCWPGLVFVLEIHLHSCHPVEFISHLAFPGLQPAKIPCFLRALMIRWGPPG